MYETFNFESSTITRVMTQCMRTLNDGNFGHIKSLERKRVIYGYKVPPWKFA